MIENPVTGVDIRKAVASDAQAVAELHVHVWRETYADVAPLDAIKVLDEAYRLQSWTVALSKREGDQQTFIANEGDRLVGLISFGSSNNDVFQGRAEIKHLYINGNWRGHGLGRHLMQIAFHELALGGHADVGLAVVEQNSSARAFYRSIGGNETTVFTDPGPLWKSTNILVSWSLPV